MPFEFFLNIYSMVQDIYLTRLKSLCPTLNLPEHSLRNALHLFKALHLVEALLLVRVLHFVEALLLVDTLSKRLKVPRDH